MPPAVVEAQPSQTSRSSVRTSDRFLEIRRFTEFLGETLTPEDCVIQSMADCSPVRWHLAHTTWFFEQFVLSVADKNYKPFHPRFAYLFNSYYVQVGDRWERPQRGLLSRPTVAEIYDYRHHVDEAVMTLLGRNEPLPVDAAHAFEIGLQHEQQHQELILTDIKHALSMNPLRPVYREEAASPEQRSAPPLQWIHFDEVISEVGFDETHDGFFYDNEGPRHRQLVPAFELAARCVTNGEYLEFLSDGGYERAELWLSEGWNLASQQGWKHPLYWEPGDGAGGWATFTLGGMKPLQKDEPVTHLSFFEADAFARWAGVDLPTEAQWEHACMATGCDSSINSTNFVDDGSFHPRVVRPAHSSLQQMLGDVWEWTASSYRPYPGYRPVDGALGEYNGKFMSNQMVLRGGSCATSRSHIRPTYRNFFPSDARWQFSGLRLARYVK